MNDEEEDVSDQYPDCFKDGNYGPSGGLCPRCGSDDFVRRNSDEEDSDMARLSCKDCRQPYEIKEELLEKKTD